MEIVMKNEKWRGNVISSVHLIKSQFRCPMHLFDRVFNSYHTCTFFLSHSDFAFEPDRNDDDNDAALMVGMKARNTSLIVVVHSFYRIDHLFSNIRMNNMHLQMLRNIFLCHSFSSIFYIPQLCSLYWDEIYCYSISSLDNFAHIFYLYFGVPWYILYSQYPNAYTIYTENVKNFSFFFTARKHYCVWYCCLLAKFVRDQLFSDFSFFIWFVGQVFSTFFPHCFWRRVLSTNLKLFSFVIRYTLHIQPTQPVAVTFITYLFIHNVETEQNLFWLDNNESRCWLFL